jgi:AcrR family transcriptional regulator
VDRYHHGDLRAALVEAGMEMARHKGAAALGMRELTRAVGVTPNAAYRHFANLRSLVLTVAQEAQHRLSRAILDRSATIAIDTDPAERAVALLRAFALGYITFALSQPGWFALTCESHEAPPDAVATAAAELPPSPHQLLLAALDGMVAAGVMAPERRLDAEWTCWSMTHGFAMLATSGPLQGGADRDTVVRLAEQAVATLIRGLRD